MIQKPALRYLSVEIGWSVIIYGQTFEKRTVKGILEPTIAATVVFYSRPSIVIIRSCNDLMKRGTKILDLVVPIIDKERNCRHDCHKGEEGGFRAYNEEGQAKIY